MRTYIYYKNKEDGNTALVKIDGEWYYAYFEMIGDYYHAVR